jgi:cytoskeletal protein RodZ
MLNNYAHFIELDADKLLLRLVDGLQSRRLEHVSAETSGTRRPSKRAARNAAVWQRFLTPDLLIGGTVIVFLFIFAIWGAARISAMRNAEVDATVPPLSNVLANMATQTVTAEITETPQTAVASTQIPGIEGIAETPIATGTFPVIDNAPLQVYVIARQRAWMRVITDKKIAFEGRVSPGNAYQFSGKEQIELLTGNAAALQVLFNQTDLGTLGVTGQVIGLLFTNAGVVTPTPMFTATPSPTSPPTITPLPSPTVATPTITPYIP